MRIRERNSRLRQDDRQRLERAYSWSSDYLMVTLPYRLPRALAIVRINPAETVGCCHASTFVLPVVQLFLQLFLFFVAKARGH